MQGYLIIALILVLVLPIAAGMIGLGALLFGLLVKLLWFLAFLAIPIILGFLIVERVKSWFRPKDEPEHRGRVYDEDLEADELHRRSNRLCERADRLQERASRRGH